MPEIDVKKVAFSEVDHNVIRVAIAETEDVAGDAVPSCRPYEHLPLRFKILRECIEENCSLEVALVFHRFDRLDSLELFEFSYLIFVQFDITF